MNNYENQKTDIDLILQSGDDIGVHKDTKKVTTCPKLDCERCLLSYRYNESHYCALNRIKWLLAEYKEPEVDWSTVPIDTPVLVSNDGEEWERRYFSRVSRYGTVFVFVRGTTSWSSNGHEAWYSHAKLAEVSDEKSK